LRNIFVLLPLLYVASASSSIDPLSQGVVRKLNLIESGKAARGSVLAFSGAELNAWLRWKVPAVVPLGVRQPRIELAAGRATGFALVDFLKLRQGAGQQTSWLLAKLIEGEKPVQVAARIQSANGKATVFLERVEIGGIAVSGRTLDVLIQTFFLPLYPDAKINEPFALKNNVERIEARPAEARVYIRK